MFTEDTLQRFCTDLRDNLIFTSLVFTLVLFSSIETMSAVVDPMKILSDPDWSKSIILTRSLWRKKMNFSAPFLDAKGDC